MSTPTPTPTSKPSPLVAKITALATGPRARAALEKVREQAAKPENRRRIDSLRARLTGRR